jgi:hypothetical protein
MMTSSAFEYTSFIRATCLLFRHRCPD